MALNDFLVDMGLTPKQAKAKGFLYGVFHGRKLISPERSRSHATGRASVFRSINSRKKFRVRKL